MSQGQGAPVLQAASRTAAPSSEALGRGCTTPAARTTRPSPSSPVSSLPTFGRREPVRAPGERRPPLGCFGPPKGALVGPGCRSLCRQGGQGRGARRGRGGGETGGGGRGAWRGQDPGGAGLAAGTPTNAGRGPGARGALPWRAAESGERRPGQRWAHSPAVGCTQPPVHSPVSGAHPRAGAHSASRARTPSGARSPADSAGAWAHTPRVTPTAAPAPASPRVAGPAPPSPRLRQEKKKTDARGLRCVGRGSTWKSRGGS